MPGFFSEIEPGRRGEILDAALDEFADRGYAGGSMRRIADRVGVSEPALYRHFSAKQALFETFVRLAARRLLSEARVLIEAAREADALGDPGPALAAALADRGAMMQRYQRVTRTILAEVVRDEAIMAIWRAELAEPGLQIAGQTIAEIDGRHGIERTPEQLHAATRIFMTTMVGYIVSTLVFTEDDSAATAEAIVRAMGWGG